jgi:hypothetical protein
LHADHRSHDEFAARTLYDHWMKCLLGVTDLLEHGLDFTDPNERMSWEVRQCELNANEDQLPVWALHHEVYSVLWPASGDSSAGEADDAFTRYVGMSTAEYFTVSSAVMAYFVNSGVADQPRAPLKPQQYFSSAKMDRLTWQAFFAVTARDVERMRDELLDEESRYGPTTFGSLTFERYPLVEVEPGMYLPISMSSLKRQITQGVYHLLGDAAERDGDDRRRHSSAFGMLFQRSLGHPASRGP